MMNWKKRLFAWLLATLALPLVAQEPWDVHFKITAGTISGAAENQIGQNSIYGLAVAGAYPLTLKGHGLIEGGYKWLPTASVTEDYTRVEDSSDVYFANVMYRHDFWRNGIYAQGGIRLANTRTVRKVATKYSSYDEEHWEKAKGIRATRAGWCLAVGYRLTDLWSVEIGASSVGFNNVAGASVSGTVFEIALCIHR